MKYAWFVVQHDGKFGLNTKRDGSGTWYSRADQDRPFLYRNQNDAVAAAARQNKLFRQLGIYQGGFKLSHNNTVVITGDHDAVSDKLCEILMDIGDGAVNITIERE